MNTIYRAANDDERGLLNNINNLVCKLDYVKFTHFLSRTEQELVFNNFKKRRDIIIKAEGGYNESERQIISFSSLCDDDITFPISCLEIFVKNAQGLTHRDYLGSIMGLGIERSRVGDILCTDSGALVFVERELCEYLTMNLLKIGRQNVVRISEMTDVKIPVKHVTTKTGTVSSIRLDAMIGLGFNVSRENAQNLIKAELVSQNHRIVKNTSGKFYEGDVLSVRGMGRIKICKIGGLSRKSRIFVEYDIY